MTLDHVVRNLPYAELILSFCACDVTLFLERNYCAGGIKGVIKLTTGCGIPQGIVAEVRVYRNQIGVIDISW